MGKTVREKTNETTATQPERKKVIIMSLIECIMLTILATLIMISAGMAVGWSSPTVPLLLQQDAPISVSIEQISWITSIMILCSSISSIPSGYCAEAVGRKATLLLGAVPIALSWCFVISAVSAGSVIELFISRVLNGLGYGIIYTAAPMYLGEIASDRVRGSLNVLITIMNKLGVLTQYCIGPYVNMQTLAGINLLFPITFFALYIWLPESPYYYIKCGKADFAEKSLKRLRSTGDVSDELVIIDNNVKRDMQNKVEWLNLVRSRRNLRALGIVIVLTLTQQLCGSSAVIAYNESIFEEVGGTVRGAEGGIMFGCIQLLSAVCSLFLVDKLGRRPLLITSAIGVSTALLVLATYFFYKYYLLANVQVVGLLPVFAIIAYTIFYSVGLSTVPIAVVAEMFPTNVKHYAASIVQICVGLSSFLVTNLFIQLEFHFGVYAPFFIFAFFSISGLLYIIFFLPETKGKSFEEIQSILKPDKNEEAL